MDFLIDASLPRGTTPLLHSRGHSATDIRDIGLRAATDPVIATYAQSRQLALVSRDFDFADIRNYPPSQYSGLVVVDLPHQATVPTILNLIDAFVQRHDVLINLPGRLAIIAPGRIRLRPAP